MDPIGGVGGRRGIFASVFHFKFFNLTTKRTEKVYLFNHKGHRGAQSDFLSTKY